jgi:capsular polysaccharide biosynthesis protein
MDNRNAYQDEIEEFFKSIGFEVINGEGFNSLQEQISFFHSVSIFAGLTGAGLTSSMFMQPGQTLIEIVCPLKFGAGENYEIHNFYKTYSMLKNHTYVGISNINRDSDSLIKELEKVSKII